MIPQPHTVTILTRSAGTDSRGDEVDEFTSSTVSGWVQQITRPPEELFSGSRDERVSRYTFFSTYTPDLTALDRVVWNGKTYRCEGQPNHMWNPAGYHHTEAHLMLAEG